jgi:hypothetical protein
MFQSYGNLWSQYNKLLAKDGSANDYFGQGFAVSLFKNSLLVGAYMAGDPGTFYYYLCYILYSKLS